MNKSEAFLFDLNGTMIDDMNFHLDVWFNVITKDLGGNLTREEVRSNMYGKNDEVLIRIFGETRFKELDFPAIARAKEERYQEIYRPHLKLLPGLHEFLDHSKEKGIRMAIGSAAPLFNIDFVLDNLDIRHYFEAVVGGEDVFESKPHPEVYLKAAKLLNTDPSRCVVFEDAPKGVGCDKCWHAIHRDNNHAFSKGICALLQYFILHQRLSGSASPQCGLSPFKNNNCYIYTY